MSLTQENYHQGFLIDEELMAGVSNHPEIPGQFLAYVLRHTTGEYLGYKAFPNSEEALKAINQIPRPWKFEKSGGGCGEGNCEKGNCGKGSCSRLVKAECGPCGSNSPEEPRTSPRQSP